MGNQQGTLAVSDHEIGWLAGVIDGEGTIAFSVYTLRHKGAIVNEVKVKPQIIVTNTDKVLVDKVVDIFIRSKVGVHVQMRTQHGLGFAKISKYKPLHVANVCGFRRVNKALELLGRHLVSKKVKAGLVKRYIDQRELKLSTNKAPLDVSDLRLMLEIMRHCADNSAKGRRSKNLTWIEGLLNEHEQKSRCQAA